MADPSDYRYTKEHEWIKVEGDIGTIGDQRHCARIFQLITHFTLAVSRIEQRGNRSGKRGCMIGSAELPAVGQEDGNDFAGFDPCCNQSPRSRLRNASVLRITDPASARGIHNRGFLAMTPARIQHQIMQENIVRISV